MPYSAEDVQARKAFCYSTHGDAATQDSPQEVLLKTRLKSIKEDRRVLGLRIECLRRQIGSVLQQRRDHLRKSTTKLSEDKRFQSFGEQVHSLREEVVDLEQQFDDSLATTFELFDELCGIRSGRCETE